MLFALVVAFALSHHEMWRDEMQAWMIARDSASIGDLYANTRFEGHAPLWFLVLYAATRVTRAPGMMQVVHGAVATATVSLVTWRAPFPRRWRVLIPFGYFFVYDYAVVSRPYALGVLLLFAFCALRTARPTASTGAALLLALLANTSLYGALLAGAATLALVVDLLSDGRWRARAARLQAARAIAVAIVGALAAAVWMTPPPAFLAVATGPVAGRAVPPGQPGMTELALTGAFRSFLPILDVRAYPRLWESSLFLAGGGPRRFVAAAAAGVLLLLGSVLTVRRRAAAVVFLVAYSVAHVAFSALVHAGAVYHHGHLFIAWLAALWLARAVAIPPTPPRPAHAPASSRREARFLDAVLCIQVAGAAIVLFTDALTPFSAGEAAAAFLRRSARDRQPIIGASTQSASTVAGYLDRPIEYPERGYTGTFTRWERPPRYPAAEAQDCALDVAVGESQTAGGGPVTVLLNAPALGTRAHATIALLRAFPTSMVGDERFYIYGVRWHAEAAPISQDSAPVARDAAPPERCPVARASTRRRVAPPVTAPRDDVLCCPSYVAPALSRGRPVVVSHHGS